MRIRQGRKNEFTHPDAGPQVEALVGLMEPHGLCPKGPKGESRSVTCVPLEFRVKLSKPQGDASDSRPHVGPASPAELELWAMKNGWFLGFGPPPIWGVIDFPVVSLTTPKKGTLKK